ncbi:MAG: ABC transporter ATP-binding protein [Clostridiales bacterium]|nr:ABC transporter ATP-binding protein [Clostridiales bacterium]
MKKHNIKSSFYAIKFCYSLFAEKCPRYLVLNSIIELISAVESFVFNILLLRVIFVLLENSRPFGTIVLVTFFALIAKLSVNLIKSFYSIRIKPLDVQNISKHIKEITYKKALSLDLIQYENPLFHGKYYKAMSEIETRAFQIVDSTVLLFSNIISTVIVLVYIVSIDPILLILAIIPVVTSVAFKVSSKKRHCLETENKEYRRQQDYVNRIVYLREYSTELRLTNIYNALKEMFLNSSKQIKNNNKKYGVVLGALRLVSDFMLTTLTLLFSYLYIGWRFFFRKDIVVSDFAVLVSAINNMNGKINSSINLFYTIQEASLYIVDFNDYMEEKPAIEKSNRDKTIDGFTEIKFEHVNFKYSIDSEYAVKDICFSIRKNEKIAIVGKNGSGKSTIIKLLVGLYEPTGGSITIDSVDVKKINYSQINELFSPVFQDYRLFATSIKDNITMGDKISDDRIWRALDELGLKQIVEQSPHKLENRVTKELNQDGLLMSGGQNQKLSLARAFASNSPIIVLDEPTASLDVKSEQMIYHKIHREMKDKTILFVSHRITSAAQADKIIVVDKGSIVEMGTHEELMKSKGVYCALYNTQAKAYVEESL